MLKTRIECLSLFDAKNPPGTDCFEKEHWEEIVSSYFHSIKYTVCMSIQRLFFSCSHSNFLPQIF